MIYFQKVMAMTNEIAYKAGFFDAYFMGSPDTNQDNMTDTGHFYYIQGYYSGLDQYTKDHKEAA